MNKLTPLQKKAILALDEVNRVFQGKDVVLYFMAALVSESHVLLFSSPGKGKSLLSESSATVLNTSYKRVQGSPGLMESHFNAKFNVAKLLKGEEEVEWRDFLKAKIKLFDELSRVPPQTLAALHSILAEKTAFFGNESLKLEPFSFIAAMNPVDTGSFELYNALIDRFDISINVPSPHFKDKSNIFRSRVYQPKSILAFGELDSIWMEVLNTNIPSSVKGTAFVISRDLQLCIHGDKEFLTNFPSVCKDCRFQHYVCSRVTNSPSERLYISALKVAQGLAYLRGKSSVEIVDLIDIMPYALVHRLNLVPDHYKKNSTKLGSVNHILQDILAKEEERKIANLFMMKYADGDSSIKSKLDQFAMNDLLVKENFSDLQTDLVKKSSIVNKSDRVSNNEISAPLQNDFSFSHDS